MTLGSDAAGGGDAGIEIHRAFDAPRDLIFRIWTDPRYVALWWGVEGATNPTCQMDVRPGGKWRIDMRTASGVLYPNAGEYLDVVPNERLVYTDVPVASSPAWHGSPPGVAVHTVTFEDEGDRTGVTLHVRFSTVVDRDRLAARGYKDGLGQAFDRVERLIAATSSGGSEAEAGAG